jgi:hypothetical protein
MNIRLLFCITVFLAMNVVAQSAPTDAAITNACVTLSRNAKDAKALGVIQAVATEDSMSAAMRSRAMVLYALPFLQQMNTNQFNRIAQVLLSIYPDEGPAILGVTESDWLAPCPACNGTGTRGGGTCLDCRGSGKIVVISPKIGQRFEVVLSELRALATENIRFAEQSKGALSARGGAKERLAALEEVIAAFSDRQQELVPLVRARDTILATLAEEAARKEAQEERLRMTRERDAIFSASESLPFSSIPVLTRQIDAFIAQYPKSEYEIELEVLKSKLQSRHKFYTNLWRGLYILGGFVVVFFIVSVVKDLIFNRKKKESMLKLPGIDEMDSNKFTDPLSDAREAAAKREADDDLGIYP